MTLAALLAIALATVPPTAGAEGTQSGTSLPMTFSGLTLSQAETAGVALSPDVLAARARVDASRAALALTRWSVLPSGFGSVSEGPQAGPTASSTIATHQATIGIQMSVNDLISAPASVRQAAAALDASVADETAAERNERIVAARAYYGALKAAAILAAREDALRLADAELRAAQTRFASGDAPRVDVVRAQVAIARAQASAETGRADDDNARGLLRVETGAAQTELATSAPGALPAVPPLALDPTAAVAAALRLRPEVAAASRQVDAGVAALEGARISLFPPLTISGGYATGVDSGQRVAGRTVSAQLTLPFPSVTSARIDEANAIVAQARARLAAVERAVALETAAAARSLVAAGRAAAATLRAQSAARQELDAAELGYRSGASSSLEVAAARSTYEQARVDELTAFYDEALAGAIFDEETGR